jgi:hypothetical protein
MVEPTPFQRANFVQLVQQYRPLLIPVGAGVGEFAFIPRRSAVAEAQAEGAVLWEMKKTAARDAWKEIEPSIVRIAETVLRPTAEHAEQGVFPQGTRTAQRKCCRLRRAFGRCRNLPKGVRLHCVCSKPRRSPPIFTWRSGPKVASKSKPSIVPLWGPAAKTMVRLVCVPTITPTTMQLSLLVRMGTTSKWFATSPRPNPSVRPPGARRAPQRCRVA